MEQNKYKGFKEFIKALTRKWDAKDLVAEIYNLFQDYVISEDQEEELYNLVDPEDEENSPGELWFSGHGCSEMYDYLR